MGLGATNKRKGSTGERYYAQIFRELGYPFCKTARMGSKLHDDAKIDLIFIPYNVQIKAGKHKGMNVGKELRAMSEAIIKSFPGNHEVHRNPQILIHYEEVGKGKRRQPENEKVYMTLERFKRYKLFHPELEYQEIKSHKNIEGEYSQTVWMTFEEFKNKIILHYVTDNTADTSGPIL